MKTARIIFLSITAALFPSCKMESNMAVSGYAVYLSSSYQGHTPYFVMADSTLTFTSNGFDSEGLKSGSLIVLLWNYYSDTEGKTEKTVETTGYELLPQTSAFFSDRPDTLGHSGADLLFSNGVANLWKMGGVYGAPMFLNIGFKYSAASPSSGLHYVHLTYETDTLDRNGRFHFKFSHEAGTDTTSTQQTSYAFVLPGIAYTSDVNGIVIHFDGIGTDRKEKCYLYTYATGKVEEALQ